MVVEVVVVADDSVLDVVVDEIVPVVPHPQRKLPFTTVAANGALFASASATLASTRSTRSPGVQGGAPSVSVMTATGPEPAGMVAPLRLTTSALIRFVAATSFALQVNPAVRSVQAAPAAWASWSSSGRSSSENDSPRTATGLSSRIGTSMLAAPGSPQTSDPLSVIGRGVVDVVVVVLVVGDDEVVEEDEVTVVVVDDVGEAVVEVTVVVVDEVVLDTAVVEVVDDVVLVVLLVVVDVLVLVELVVAEQGRFAGRGRQRSVTLSESAVGMAPRPTASTRSDCRP